MPPSPALPSDWRHVRLPCGCRMRVMISPKVALFLTSGGLLGLGLHACGGDSTSPQGKEPKSPNQHLERQIHAKHKLCLSQVNFRTPWPGKFLGGPTDGPISFATGERALEAKADTKASTFFVKALLLVDARPGTPIDMSGEDRAGEKASFTHFSDGTIPRPTVDAVLPDRGQSRNRPADIPGYIFVRKAGCYTVQVRVAGRKYEVDIPIKIPGDSP